MESAAISTGADVLTALKRIVLEITQLRIAPEQVSDQANLFNDCGLDSTSVVELVLTLEQEFDISIGEDELDVRLFQDLSSLAAFIESKRRLAHGASE